jgi:hypothetical protein
MRRSFSLCALLLLASSAGAQDTTSSTGKFLLGVGVDLKQNGVQQNGPPLSLQLGYQRERAGSRLGLRLFGDYSTSSGGATVRTPDYLSSSHSAGRTFDAGAAVTYALTRTRIQPYLIGGAGVAQTSMRASGVFATSATPDQPSGVFGAPQVSSLSRSGWNGFLQVGVGVATRVHGVTLFSELRENAGLDILGPRWGSPSLAVAPLTFGVRFD